VGSADSIQVGENILLHLHVLKHCFNDQVAAASASYSVTPWISDNARSMAFESDCRA